MKLQDLWKPRERFLILDIAPKKTQWLLLSVDEEKNIVPEKFWDDFSFEEAQSKKFAKLGKRKLIVSADPSLTAVISFPVEFQRGPEISSHAITSEELENMFSQAIGKVFNARRREASARLKLHELDTILVNVKIRHCKVDGHSVLNPVGFKGKHIHAVFELTFTTRGIFENLKHFFNAKEGFFFTESAHAGLRALAGVESPPLSLLVLGTGGSSTFLLERTPWGQVISQEEIRWPLRSMFEAIATALPVSHDTVLRLYHLYLTNDTSDNFRRAFGRILKDETDKLLAEVKKSKAKGNMYLHTPVPLPLVTPLRHGAATIQDVPIINVLDRAGFKVDFSEWPATDSEVFMRLAPFLDFYHDKSDSEINHALRRRLHWLIQ